MSTLGSGTPVAGRALWGPVGHFGVNLSPSSSAGPHLRLSPSSPRTRRGPRETNFITAACIPPVVPPLTNIATGSARVQKILRSVGDPAMHAFFSSDEDEVTAPATPVTTPPLRFGAPASAAAPPPPRVAAIPGLKCVSIIDRITQSTSSTGTTGEAGQPPPKPSQEQPPSSSVGDGLLREGPTASSKDFVEPTRRPSYDEILAQHAARTSHTAIAEAIRKGGRNTPPRTVHKMPAKRQRMTEEDLEREADALGAGSGHDGADDDEVSSGASLSPGEKPWLHALD